MVLCPEFLPRDQPQPAKVAPAPRRRRCLRRRRRTNAARERLSGTLQYVFGSGDPGFSMDETFGGEIAPRPAPRRASGVETHHLACRRGQAMTSGVATTGPATPFASTNCRTAR